MIIFLISHQSHNYVLETVQMRGHNICFYAELTEITSNYRKILPLIYSFVDNVLFS